MVLLIAAWFHPVAHKSQCNWRKRKCQPSHNSYCTRSPCPSPIRSPPSLSKTFHSTCEFIFLSFLSFSLSRLANLPGTAVAHQLVVAIRQKCTPEEVVNILKDIPSSGYSGEEMSDGSFNALKIDVFVQTLLNLGSKSFSHSFAAISKFHVVFRALAETEEAQICILHNIYELWSSHQQMMVVLIDKLLKLQIVDCSAVATWIFSKEMTGEFTKMYLWEILHLTIKKMNKHVIKLSK